MSSLHRHRMCRGEQRCWFVRKYCNSVHFRKGNSIFLFLVWKTPFWAFMPVSRLLPGLKLPWMVVFGFQNHVNFHEWSLSFDFEIHVNFHDLQARKPPWMAISNLEIGMNVQNGVFHTKKRKMEFPFLKWTELQVDDQHVSNRNSKSSERIVMRFSGQLCLNPWTYWVTP